MSNSVFERRKLGLQHGDLRLEELLRGSAFVEPNRLIDGTCLEHCGL